MKITFLIHTHAPGRFNRSDCHPLVSADQKQTRPTDACVVQPPSCNERLNHLLQPSKHSWFPTLNHNNRN